MADPFRDPRDDEELAALVDELETTLADLRAELTDRERERGGRSPDRRRDDRGGRRRPTREPPRPPAVGELFRFTSDYTIPTVVAVLEATVEALELLQGVIDLAAPGETPERRRRRSGRRDRRGLGRSVLSDALADGVTSATDRATADAADALARLRETLAEADLPNDDESRDLVADARDLSAELERRVRESRATVDRERERERRDERGRGGRRDDGPVSIAVGGPDGTTDGDDERRDATDSRTDAEDDDPDEEEPAPQVDVDAELESIKRRMGKSDDAADGPDRSPAEAADTEPDDGDDGADGSDDGATADGTSDTDADDER
ncbi:DUF7547 family protein [Halobaculum litoreum]|uniref:DUF7547 family protein n=1 Tax=Halobaculum litoreum TaxID=3031998 RepID=UPI0024C36386|nr:hypothetical protein [Halobaculum sp. DT92]